MDTTKNQIPLQHNEKIYYVYAHRKLTDNSVFYIGKGKGGRSKSRSGRSNHWRNIVNKHGYYIDYLYSNLSNEQACLLEIETIKYFRDNGSAICNIFNGGEAGNVGIKLTDEHKEKLRKAKLGKPQSLEHAQKSRLNRKGKKNTPEHTERTISLKRKKIIDSNGVIYKSANEASRILSKQYDKRVSQGNISMCARGKRNNAYDRSWSYDITKIPNFKKDIPGAKKIHNKNNGMVFESVQLAKEWVTSLRGKKANNQPISACARGETKIAYGYEWEYL